MRRESVKDAPEIKLSDYLNLKDLRLVEHKYLDIPCGAGEIIVFFELSKKSTQEFGFDIPIQCGYVRLTENAKKSLGFSPDEISLHDWQDGSWLLSIKNKTDEKIYFASYEDVKNFMQNARRNRSDD